jgi:polyphosphate kinase
MRFVAPYLQLSETLRRMPRTQQPPQCSPQGSAATTGGRSTEEATDLRAPALYINRELSWLEFNERVLDQARDAGHPLLERIKFLAITAANLDEFFMIRVATTLKKLRLGVTEVSVDGHDAVQQLSAMRTRAERMLRDQLAVWQELREHLAREEITFLEPEDWTPAVRDYLAGYFSREICPVLTPLAFDPGHPFPYISNRSKNFAVVVQHANRTKFARVKVPDVLPRFVPIPAAVGAVSHTTFVFLEDIIAANMRELFAGTEVKAAYLFRIVRDTDLEIEQAEADDLLVSIDRSLKLLRHGPISLLQVHGDMPDRVLNILIENFETQQDVVVRTTDRMGLADWMELLRLPRPELKDVPFSASHVWRSEGDPEVIFEQLRHQDVVVHHPFDSFGSVASFLRAAVTDPHVIAVKMTMYRIGKDSPLIPLLMQAAENGKQVAVLVELKARFDERNNIVWAQQLESHGIHVVYGFADLKTHAKLCLVVRREPDGIQRYVHIGTGNYNPQTAKLYTDLGMFTSNPDIVADVTDVFNHLTGYSTQREFRRLLVAPLHLRVRLVELIEREAAHAAAGRPSRIIIKVNAITDDEMIRTLYRASQAGVPIDLIVRGICSLRPGVAGVSETIRVRSIVGRFLEHSRVYWFLNGGDDEMYVGSADLMERNLDRRVEALVPVLDRDIRRTLRDVVLHAYLQDNHRASALASNGQYAMEASAAERFNAQQHLLQHYGQRSE